MIEKEDFKKRIQDLAKEKSRLQMTTDLLNDLTKAQGLEEVVHNAIYTIMDAWGGTNVILYYELDGQWYRSDVYNELVKIDSIKDSQVESVMLTGVFVENLQINGELVLPALPRFSGKQQTLIYPLKTGDEIIGAIKMEGIFLDITKDIKEVLLIIVNYISMILRNELFSAGKLMLANKALKNEMFIRSEEEKRYRHTIESSFDGFWVVNLQGQFVEVNDIYCQMIGYTKNELLNMGISDVEDIENPDETAKHIKKIIEIGKDRFESRHRCKDGTIIDLEVNAIFTDYKGGMFYAFLRDISFRKEAEIERLRLEEQYFQAQKVESIGRLAGGVAHDLNNLLSPILGYSELLINDFEANDARKQKVDYILQAGLRARDLVHQLLAFSRKQALVYQLINLNDVILKFKQLLRSTIREDIELQLNLSHNLDNIKADVGQIEQVLMNLSVNAQDAMAEGGVLLIETEQVEIEGFFTDPLQDILSGEYVLLTLSDTGVGMDQETKSQIFEPFYSTKGEQGNGLGLATVFGIVTQHGGGIQLSTELDKGSSFKIYLPVSHEIETVEKGSSIKENQLQIAATILLVEDDDTVRELASEILGLQGYKIKTAANGLEALSILKDEKDVIDLLLSDVIMPGMNGRELYDLAVKIFPGLKVVFMSGYTDDIVLTHGVNNESVSFLQKPYTIESLNSKIHETLML